MKMLRMALLILCVAFGGRYGAQTVAPAEEASFGPRRRKRVPARSGFPRHGYLRAPGPGNGIVDDHDPYRYRSADEEKTRVQRQKPE